MKMRKKANPGAVVLLGWGAVALATLLSGCEPAATKKVRANPPETPVAAAPAPVPPPVGKPRTDSGALEAAPKAGVEYLIEKVEAAFQSGEANYKAGHMEKARKDFDRAVDWLLESGYALDSDARLEKLFDRVVETIHGYELEAFREGDGFDEPKPEPAAIDEIAEMTFPVDPRLKEKLEKQMLELPHDLPLTVNDTVLQYVNFFQTPRGRAIVENGLRRGGQYREMIQRTLREEGLPQDLIYLAQAESAFQPRALSRARAVGMWQFMSFTGREYGLRRTWWVDDRQDPEKATRAAAKHLRDLYELYQDWYLAMAAYNSGAGNVTRAIERTGHADFWELYKRNALPRETKNYVPIILALSLIAKDAERYGIRAEPEAPQRYDRVKPVHALDLRLVAESIDESVERLKALNPQLLRMTTPADPEFELRLPEGMLQRFLAEIALIPPEKWVSWRRHRVEEGDVLSAIAKKYGTSTQAIAEANGLDSRGPLEVGLKLIIPAAARPQSEQGKLVRYRVRRGDTLASIAEQFDVSVAELRGWNGLRSDRLARGARLKVYPGGKPAPQRKAPAAPTNKGTKTSAGDLHTRKSGSRAKLGKSGTVHHVKAGETLWSIARAYETTVESIRTANRFLASRPIRPGDQLMVLPRP